MALILYSSDSLEVFFNWIILLTIALLAYMAAKLALLIAMNALGIDVDIVFGKTKED